MLAKKVWTMEAGGYIAFHRLPSGVRPTAVVPKMQHWGRGSVCSSVDDVPWEDFVVGAPKPEVKEPKEKKARKVAKLEKSSHRRSCNSALGLQRNCRKQNRASGW